MNPDLPETYYLDNVLTLFDHVTRVYRDILEPGQVEFLACFAALSEDAKKLYIRLLNRSHTWFRRSKLNYGEIASIDDALTELAQAGCLRLNPEVDADQLLSLFTKPELLAASEDQSGLKQLRRPALVSLLLERDEAAFFDRLKVQDMLIELNNQDDYQLCQMLFFGNLNQSMTDFVLSDLGLYLYENYSIDPEHRPYRSSLEIQQHWLLHQLESLLELSGPEQHAALVEYAAMIPSDIAEDSPAYRKSEQLRYQIARQLERIGKLAAAVRLYRQCYLPPSRERIARILDRQRKHDGALTLCREMIEQPVDESELHFACMFAARLIKRHEFEPLPLIERHRISHRPDMVELELEKQDSVEIAVAEYYDHADGEESCYFLENSLFNGVLGLLIWEAVFAPLPGAFYNPFQHRPSDFYTHDFFERRQALIDPIWASIKSNEDMRKRVHQYWRLKNGLMNPLVNWQDLNLEIIDLALDRIAFAHWRAVFERILQDLRNHRAGFPDLTHFPPEGGYCLVEVKGPGDSLQKNQQRWMQYFHEHGIPHRLAKVTWKPD